MIFITFLNRRLIVWHHRCLRRRCSLTAVRTHDDDAQPSSCNLWKCAALSCSLLRYSLTVWLLVHFFVLALVLLLLLLHLSWTQWHGRSVVVVARLKSFSFRIGVSSITLLDEWIHDAVVLTGWLASSWTVTLALPLKWAVEWVSSDVKELT